MFPASQTSSGPTFAPTAPTEVLFWGKIVSDFTQKRVNRTGHVSCNDAEMWRVEYLLLKADRMLINHSLSSMITQTAESQSAAGSTHNLHLPDLKWNIWLQRLTDSSSTQAASASPHKTHTDRTFTAPPPSKRSICLSVAHHLIFHQEPSPAERSGSAAFTASVGPLNHSTCSGVCWIKSPNSVWQQLNELGYTL